MKRGDNESPPGIDEMYEYCRKTVCRTIVFTIMAALLLALLFFAGGAKDVSLSLEAAGKEPDWTASGGGMVMAIDISSDGEYIISGSNQGYIRLFSYDNSSYIWSDYTSDWTNAVSISDHGELMAAACGNSFEGAITVYNVSGSGEPIWEYRSSESNMEAVEVSGDGQYIIVGEYDNYVRFFQANSSTPLWSFRTEKGIRDVTISRDGSYCAAGSVDDHVYFFERGSSTPLWSHEVGACWTVDMTADGEYIVAGGNGYPTSAYLFHRSSGEPIMEYPMNDWVESVSISDDGRFITAGDRENYVYLFDREQEGTVWSYKTGGRVEEVTISGNGQFLAAASWDESVYFFNASSSTPDWTYATDDEVYCIAIAERAQYLVAGSRDENIYLFHEPQLFPVPVARIESPAPSTELVGDEIHFVGSSSIPASNISEYVWKSSLDGSIGTSADFTISNLSLGTHTITFSFRDTDDLGSMEDSVELIMHERPTANIDSISPSPALDTVTFSGHGTDDGTITGYVWRSSIDGEFYNDTEANFDYGGLSNGTHTIFFRVQDNNGVWSDEASTNITITEYIPPDQKPTEDPTSEDRTRGISETFRFALIGLPIVLTSLAVLLYAAHISEALRYRLLQLFLPLYTRNNEKTIEKDIRQQNIRGRIFQHIKDHSGTNFTSIKKAVDAGYGTTMYHLSVLQRKGYIRSSVNGRKKCFWMKEEFPGIENAALTDIQQGIIKLLTRHGKMSWSEMSSNLEVSKTTIRRNVGQMENKGMVSVEKEGKNNYCTLKSKEMEYASGDAT